MIIMPDTDVLVSAIFFPSERTRRFIREVSEGHSLLLCDCVIEELELLVERKFPDKKTALEQFLIALPYQLVVTERGQGRVERVLKAAETEDVDMIISGDRSLRRRKTEVSILTVSEFLGRMIMRKMLSWKLVLRARLKTALTLLLIIAATFLFLYNLLEYTMTNRQYQEAMAQYWGNITLDRATFADGESTAGDLDEWDGLVFLSSKENPVATEKHAYERYHKEGFTAEEIAELMELPYIDDVSTRYMTAGISEDFTRIDTHSIPATQYFEWCRYDSRIVFEATVLEKDHNPYNHPSMGLSFGSIAGESELHNLLIDDIEVLAGDPQWLNQVECYSDEENLPEGKHRITYDVSFPETIENQELMLASGGGVGSPIFYQVNHVDQAFHESLEAGRRYIFVCRISPDAWQMSGRVPYGFMAFGDDTIYDWWPYAYDVTDLPENYIEGEEFAPLRELIKITNDDMHTMDVVYAEDMRTIRRYQEGKFLLMDGRFLNEQDTAEKKPVCVIADTFAETYGLKLGDTISLRLGDKLFENYAPVGAVASFRQRYAENFTEEQEFEIVGLYHEVGLETLKPGLRYWTYSENAIFVPQSFLPVSDEALADWALSPADVSLIVSDAKNITPFADEVLSTLSEMGYVTYYSDSGWPEISEQLQQTGLLSLLKLIAFSAAVVLVLLLTMYLFVIQRKKEFAVMRALGCPKKNAVAVLLFPLSLLAVIGVALGAGLAVCYTSVTFAEKLKSYAEFGHAIDGSIPVAAVLLSVVACFALLMIFAFVGLAYIARLNPLELLQGGSRSKKKKAKRSVVAETAPVEVRMEAIRGLEPIEAKSKPAPGFMWRYIRRHACRSLGKTVLLILVTALLVGAMGQFSAVRNSYQELYQAIDVKVRFLDFELAKAKKFAETDYVTGGYYEYNYVMGEIPLPTDEESYVYGSYCVSNNILHNVPEAITFLEGYDAETVMDVNERICVMPHGMMEKLGVQLGDTVELNENNYLPLVEFYNQDKTHEEHLDMYHRHGVKVQIVGSIDSMDNTVYVPLAAKGYFKSLFDVVYLSFAEYSLADYHRAIELRTYAKSLLEPDDGHQPRFSMDTSEADRIYNTYQMIETLYPIAFATAVIIGAIIMGLLILQRAKEAATLRILGATNGRTRTLLAVEQILLCIIGLVLAIAALFVINGGELLKTSAAIGIYLAVHVAACVIGCIAGAVSVTRHKALELLQVKE